jgi:signal transduction histidine kinase/DNA-binding response OmpR family regulator
MKTIKIIHPFFLYLLLILFNNDGYAQNISLSLTQKFPINITESIEIFRDSTAKLSLAQVSNRVFQKSKKNYFLFPYSDDVFWVRFSLKNTNQPNKDWILEWDNPLVEQLDFYISDSTGKSFLHKQQKIITTERPKPLIDENPKFVFDLGLKKNKVIYIKLTSKRGHYGNLKLYTSQAYYNTRLNSSSGQGFFNGLVIFRLFLVLTLSFFVIKDLAFRLYSFHTVIKTFAFWGYVNISGPLFTSSPDLAKKIDFLCYNSVTMGAGIFILFTIGIHKLPKWHTFLLYVFIGFTIFLGIIIFFDYQWYWLKAGVYNIVFSSIYFILLYVYCVVKKISLDRYYVIPFSLGLMSYALLYFRLLGWIEHSAIYGIAYYLFFGEIFVFVFFLGRIIRNSELNKALIQQQLNFNLQQNTRLKELDNLKTRFFTNISHEFRTPLTLLVGPIDDLQKKYPNEGIIRVMQRNIQRLQTLINQLLDLSKLEAGEMKTNLQEVDLAKYLDQLFASFESLAQSKNIIFNHSKSHLTQLALFDLDKLEKIITNLLSNAFKFTPQNGRISVRVEYSQAPQPPEGELLSITIQDNGIGISPERLPHIFDRFYQVDDSSQNPNEGTGIGLSLVKELVDLLKGQIDVSSKVGEGTVFTLILPYEPIKELTTPISQFILKNSIETVFEDKSTVNDFKVEEHGQAIMLIVEDNPDLRNYMASIFENQYQLVMAVDGEDGLAKAIEYVPDIVISDLMMPKLDGLGFCEKLKNDERINHIPVVMLTAKASISDKLIGLKFGADDYLSKPFNKEELTLRVSNLVNQRQLMREKYAHQTLKVLPEIEVKKELTMDELFIQKAKSIIDKYLDKSEFDVEKFADEMNLSAVQLRRKLKAITDQTVTEFVRNYRLEIAADLLKKGEFSVSEIAYKVGFDSLPYFSKVFQEKYGKVASEWK